MVFVASSYRPFSGLRLEARGGPAVMPPSRALISAAGDATAEQDDPIHEGAA